MRLWRGKDGGVSDYGLSQVLVGLEMSAVSMVRDYVEFLFDGPIVRALANPRGRLGDLDWQFPAENALSAMRLYIGRTITGVELREDENLTLEFGEDRIVVPLDDESRPGPEAAHVVGADDLGLPDTKRGL